jgi:hypothetical protein
MAVGLPAEVTLDAYPARRYTGRLERLAPVATPGMSDKVRTLSAVFSVQKGDSTLTPDLSAAVDVRLGSWADALAVPRRALTWRDGVAGVSVGGKWRAVKVTAITEVEAVLADGVTAGDRVDLPGDVRS